MTSKEFEKMFLDLNSVLVKFWKEQGRPDKEIKIELLERMLNWYKKMGYCTLDAQSANGSSEIPKDLEEAANKFAVFYDQGTCDGIAQECFIAGAKWQKEKDEKELSEKIAAAYQLGLADKEKQMMSESVEKTVGQLERQWGGNIHFMHGFEVDEMDFPFLNSQECGYGDKVRIIIVKEDLL